MNHRFRITKAHTKITQNSTIQKAIDFIRQTDLEPPYLLMDRARVRQKVHMIGKNIRNAEVYYAVKANPDIETLKLINSLGMGFEIASEGEMMVLESIGVSSNRMITSNPIKTFRFLRLAAESGITYFSYDSEAEVLKMREYTPGANVYVRLTVPNEGSEWPLSKKFGVEVEEATELLLLAKKKGLNPVGITFHVGSQCTNMYNWISALDKAKDLWDRAEKVGIKLTLLNIGGGYPIRYTKDVVGIPAIEKNINKAISQKFPKKIRILIEPGRSVVGDAGIFVTKVIGKTSRGDEKWLSLDVGVFNGLMESIGGIKYSYVVEGSKEIKAWTLAGPSCDSLDVIEKNIRLPEPAIGNYILILSGGAYTISYASEFNGFSIPKTILI